MLQIPKTVRYLIFSMLFWMLAASTTAAQTPPEAERHFNRGMAAVEMAKDAEDYELAIEEFLKAQALAPDWADLYYNLGLVQEKAGQAEAALASLRRYLLLAPDAKDAAQVRQFIDRLEYRLERETLEVNRPNVLLGAWKRYIPDTGQLMEEHVFSVTSGSLTVSLTGWGIIVPVNFDGKNVRFKYVHRNPGVDVEYEFVGQMVSPTRIRGNYNSLVVRSNLPVTPVGRRGVVPMEYWKQ
jgi:tetratricopeptide (TPR) repeat protein